MEVEPIMTIYYSKFSANCIMEIIWATITITIETPLVLFSKLLEMWGTDNNY